MTAPPAHPTGAAPGPAAAAQDDGLGPAPPPLPDAELNKSQKFVRLLEALQVPGGAMASALIARFELDERSLRRYISDLRELGLPLRAEGRGHERRIWLDPSYGRHRVQLSLLELISLKFGRAAFRFLEGTGFASDMDEALETLSALSGSDLARAEHLDRKFIAVPEHPKDHARDADHIDELLSALIYQNPVQAHYAKVGSRTGRYTLLPLTLAIYKQSLYLFAVDQAVDRVKTFAVDRFRAVQRVRGEHFAYPEDYQPDQLYADAFGIIGGDVEEVRLRFNLRAAPYIAERQWQASQRLVNLAGGQVGLHMRVGVSPELVQWVLSFGPDVVVEAPDSLADRVRQLHLQAAAAYAAGAP